MSVASRLRQLLLLLMPFVLLVTPAWSHAADGKFVPFFGYPGIEVAHFEYNTANHTKLTVFKPINNTGTPRPAVLTVHGGSWRYGSHEWTYGHAAALAKSGYVGIAVQYRLAYNGVTPLDQVKDICQALRFIRQQGPAWSLDTNRVAALGWSAGGHLVTVASLQGCADTIGTDTKLAGSRGNGGADMLLLWSPALDTTIFPDFAPLLLGRAKAAQISPVHLLREQAPPVYMVHGELDRATPPESGRRFCQIATRLKGECDMHVYAGVGHMLNRKGASIADHAPDPNATPDAWKRIMQFLSRHWQTTKA